ncbi:MAG: hypothetical protein ACYDER_21305 [Ktedonobacteraceae bacterium]
MAKDYILFLHGVNVREFPDTLDDPNFPVFANPLFELIQHALYDNTLTLEKIPIYYGDINMHEESTLLEIYRKSSAWKDFWFKQIRETLLLQIIGDIALYISPYIGSKIVERLHKVLVRIQREVEDHQEGGRLHLVCHSLGTIILFDVLFASRWDDKNVPGYDCIMEIREALCGLGDNTRRGIRVASINTMGSPIALFSLLNMHSDQQKLQENMVENTHDISPRLQQFLQQLSQQRGGKPLPWWNFAHPGDPLASPLATLIPELVDREGRYLEVHDMITISHNLEDILTESFSQSPAALIHGKAAHHSYWTSRKVAIRIARTIKEASELEINAFDQEAS